MGNLINFDLCEVNNRMYGGLSGSKIGLVYNGDNYLVKYPKNLRTANMKNVVLSYSNSPACEYIGSHIYALLGIPVHETLIGTRKNKNVVACKDFLNHGDRLYEFREIKTTFEPAFINANGDETDGTGTDITEALITIHKHPIFKQLSNIEERFWEMFIVDAYIGNSDRNNGNWGIIIRYDDSVELAPVYDNGGCLNNKWDEEKMLKHINDPNLMHTQAYKGVICAFTNNDKKINPFQFIAKTDNDKCLSVLKKIYPLLNKQKPYIHKLINEMPWLTDVQKNFYTKILDVRLYYGLKPVYDRICKQNNVTR